MPKLDLYKDHKAEYVAPRRPVLLAVKPATYLVIDGQGPPGAEAFQNAIGALYGVAFTIKFAKKAVGTEYAVCKLEGLWYGGPPEWKWKLMIRTPDFVRAADLKSAKRALEAKGKGPETGRVALEKVREGRCVQALHVGPYEKVEETVSAMRAFAESRGLELLGPHHEIYLSDPRRVAAAKLRTIVRHPVK